MRLFSLFFCSVLLAAASSRFAVSSDGQALSLLWHLDLSSGHRTLVKNLTHLGGVAGGAVLRRLGDDKLALIGLNASENSDANYFSILSLEGSTLVHDATETLLLSLETYQSTAFCTASRNGQMGVYKVKAIDSALGRPRSLALISFFSLNSTLLRTMRRLRSKWS